MRVLVLFPFFTLERRRQAGLGWAEPITYLPFLVLLAPLRNFGSAVLLLTSSPLFFVQGGPH